MLVKIYEPNKGKRQIIEDVYRVEESIEESSIEIYTDSSTPIIRIRQGKVQCYNQKTITLLAEYQVGE